MLVHMKWMDNNNVYTVTLVGMGGEAEAEQRGLDLPFQVQRPNTALSFTGELIIQIMNIQKDNQPNFYAILYIWMSYYSY